MGMGLVFFGPEGYRATGFSTARYTLGALVVPGQALWIVGATLALMAALALLFNHTLAGKALRATALSMLRQRRSTGRVDSSVNVFLQASQR